MDWPGLGCAVVRKARSDSRRGRLGCIVEVE